MKKIVISLLILTLIFGIVGCTTDNTDEETDAAYSSEDIIIGKGTDYELHGKLTIPDGADSKNPCPAVVLVHGSGPSDMNGVPSALPDFPNTPFKDIAEYLASKGIAVIRYDKRTFSHAEKMVQAINRLEDITVYHETIEDALLAAEILRADGRINPEKVFIIGHSMGGMLAPRIHAEGGNFAGIISFAGSPRSIHDITFDQQMDYWDAMPDSEDKEYALSPEYREFYYTEVAAILNMPDGEAKITPVGGSTAYYYKDWDKILTPVYVKDINVPFLIMQGEKDFQVYAGKDYTAWQELLKGRSNVTFKLYEELNHLFMKSTTGDIEEYKVKDTVDKQVLADIAEWIKAN